MIHQTSRTKIVKVDGYGLTPTIIYERLNGTHKVLLETATSHTSVGRYSIIGANPRKTYIGSNSNLKEYVHATNKTYEYEGDLIQLLKQVMPKISNETSYPFTGGAIGYFRYNRDFKEIAATQFHIYDYIFLFDHLTEELIGIYTNIEPHQQDDQLEQMLQQILTSSSERTTYEIRDYDFTSTNETIIHELNSIKENMTQQNVSKLVIAKLKKSKFSGSPFAYYKAFRKNSPTPFQYFLNFEDFQVFGSAKNGLLKIEQQSIFSNDEKSIPFIESNSTNNPLYTSAGKLKETYTAIDVLANVLPPTTKVGLPFLQADALLNTCNVDERILYGGAIGYIGFNGQIEFVHTEDAVMIKNEQAIKEHGFEINLE